MRCLEGQLDGRGVDHDIALGLGAGDGQRLAAEGVAQVDGAVSGSQEMERRGGGGRRQGLRQQLRRVVLGTCHGRCAQQECAGQGNCEQRTSSHGSPRWCDGADFVLRHRRVANSGRSPEDADGPGPRTDRSGAPSGRTRRLQAVEQLLLLGFVVRFGDGTRVTQIGKMGERLGHGRSARGRFHIGCRDDGIDVGQRCR